MTSREIPAELVNLMKLALAGGNIDEVSLDFEGLGYDFYAPIGWFLFLTKVSPELRVHAGATPHADGVKSLEPEMLRISAHVSAPEPTAYLGTDPQSGEAHYWDAAAIAQWIETPRDIGTVGAPVAAPDEHIDLAISAAKSGWCVTRQLSRYGHSPDPSLVNRQIPTSVSYRFTAHNYAYNDETSAHHRDTGADVSLNLVLGIDEQAATWSYALQNAHRVDPMHITEAVAQVPPWYARVARFDEDLDEWVL